MRLFKDTQTVLQRLLRRFPVFLTILVLATDVVKRAPDEVEEEARDEIGCGVWGFGVSAQSNGVGCRV